MLMLVVLMLILILLNLNTGNANTNDNLYIRSMPCAVFAVTKVTFLGQLSSFLPVICHVTFDPNTSEDALQYAGVSFPPASRNMNHPLNALSHFWFIEGVCTKARFYLKVLLYIISV